MPTNENKESFMKKAWRFLDGKKTAIGSAMLIASNFVAKHTVAYQVLYYGGVLLGGTGLVHKAKKGEFKSK